MSERKHTRAPLSVSVIIGQSIAGAVTGIIGAAIALLIAVQLPLSSGAELCPGPYEITCVLLAYAGYLLGVPLGVWAAGCMGHRECSFWITCATVPISLVLFVLPLALSDSSSPLLIIPFVLLIPGPIIAAVIASTLAGRELQSNRKSRLVKYLRNL